MCLILFSQNHHPDYKLVLAANRDEFFKRPTRPAHRWNDGSDIIAGQDLRAGGTWMGVNTAGRIAAVTNYRDLSVERKAIRSRGALVTEMLSVSDPQGHIELLRTSNEYDGYNLLYWEGERMQHFSNISKEISSIEDGIHGLSNHLLNTPWFKVEQGKQRMKDVLARSGNDLVEDLFELLQDNREGEENNLPETGLPKDLERKVSAMFIRTENYGTRCSTVLLVAKDGSVRFEERSFIPEANAVFNL